MTLPESSSSARHDFAQRRRRAAAGLARPDRLDDFRRRQDAADDAANSRERLDEVQVGDHRRGTTAAARQRTDVRAPARRRRSWRASARCRRGPRRCSTPPPRGARSVADDDAGAGQRQHEREHLPAERVRQETRTDARRCGRPTETPPCPRRPALMRSLQSDRTNGSGL